MIENIKERIEKQYIISKLKKEAKILHRQNPQQSLMTCQNLVAQKHGYLHWHELHTLVKNRLLKIDNSNLTSSNLDNSVYLGLDDVTKQKLYLQSNFRRLLIEKNQETNSLSSNLFKQILTQNKSQLIYCCNDKDGITNNLENYAKEFKVDIYRMDFSNHDYKLYFDFNHISSGSLTELLFSLVMKCNGTGSFLWSTQAASFISGLIMALTHMKNIGEIKPLTPRLIMESMSYTNIIALHNREDFPNHIRTALKSYLISIPGFQQNTTIQNDTFLEQHGHIQMQYIRVLGNMIDSQLFETNNNKKSFNHIIQSEKPYIVLVKFPLPNDQFNFHLLFEYWRSNWNKFNQNIDKGNTNLPLYFCVDTICEINMNLPSSPLVKTINFICIDHIKNIESYETQYKPIKIIPLDNEQISIQ